MIKQCNDTSDIIIGEKYMYLDDNDKLNYGVCSNINLNTMTIHNDNTGLYDDVSLVKKPYAKAHNYIQYNNYDYRFIALYDENFIHNYKNLLKTQKQERINFFENNNYIMESNEKVKVYDNWLNINNVCPILIFVIFSILLLNICF